MALAKKNRLISKKDFNLVLRKGFAIKGHFLLIKYVKTALPMSRFGMVISLKVAGNVVSRNKIKRTLLEVVSHYLKNDKGGLDVVVLVNRKDEGKNLVEDLSGLLDKINLSKEDVENSYTTN